MCRVEERVYISSDGRRQVFEDTFPCDKARGKSLCSKVKRRTTEYFPKHNLSTARDGNSSPASNTPSTPNGSGGYLVEEHKPSATARPSTRGSGDRQIVIEFGSKKDKGKKYHGSRSSKSYKRSSLGAASTTSNDVAIESPRSDASYPIPTGFPDSAVPPTDNFGQLHGFSTRHAAPQSHHRHTSSSASSQPPSLYATSDPESLPGRRQARYPPTIVHNPPPGTASSPTTSRAAPSSSSQYRTTTHAPQGSSRDNVGPDGLSPLDYSEFIDHSASSRTGSSHASSGRAAAPEITDRAADRERRRKQKEDDKRRQEETDRRLAEELAQQEDVKQVRFELGRAEERQRQRGENKIAESEKRRAEERDEIRQRRKDGEKRATEKPKREKTQPPTRDFNIKPRHHSRRSSMTQADIDERNRLLLQDQARMNHEREAAEQREKEERAAELRQQQQTSGYWDPRGGDRYPIPNGPTRRDSVSRRGSISSTAPPMGLSRTNSNRRASIVQPAPPSNLPPLTTSFPQQQYSTRPTSSHRQAAAPVFSPGSYNSSTRPAPSARHSSYHDNPFAQPPTRGSHASHTSQSSSDNPFAQPPTRNVHPPHENPFAQPQAAIRSPPESVQDPWDSRNMREALPRTGSHRESQTLQRRGEDVISRADDRPRGHGRAQQATVNLGRAAGYGSSSENEEDRLAGYGARLGLGRRKN